MLDPTKTGNMQRSDFNSWKVRDGACVKNNRKQYILNNTDMDAVDNMKRKSLLQIYSTKR